MASPCMKNDVIDNQWIGVQNTKTFLTHSCKNDLSMQLVYMVPWTTLCVVKHSPWLSFDRKLNTTVKQMFVFPLRNFKIYFDHFHDSYNVYMSNLVIAKIDFISTRYSLPVFACCLSLSAYKTLLCTCDAWMKSIANSFWMMPETYAVDQHE